MNIRLALFALGTSALLGACVSQPQPLQGTFAQLSPQDATATNSTGALVRWGGRIVAVEPQSDRTCFEMIATQLSGTARPYWASDDVAGRFIACRTGFYDPALFQVDREVTFIGRISGYRNQKIGEYDYRFPLVEADVVYLWPVRERVDVVSYPAPWPWGWW